MATIFTISLLATPFHGPDRMIQSFNHRAVSAARPTKVALRCHTRRCDRTWAKHHPPKFVWTPFVLCVFNHEAGDGQAMPSNARLSTINFRYDAEGYEGAGNWITSTWRAMGGKTAHAYEATPREQAEVFMRHANARDWPVSVPACGGP